MRLARRPTRWLCIGLTLLLLGLQCVTSAYACPALSSHGDPAMAAMPDCDAHKADPAAMDPEQPLLCQAHCQQGSQAPHHAPVADAPGAPLLLAVLDWSTPPVLPACVGGRTLPLQSGAPPPGAPPLYLSLLVLRN